MSVSEGVPNELGVSEVMRLTIGLEFDYYNEQLHGIPPEKFAVIKVGGATVEQDLDQLAGDIAVLAKLGLYPVVVHGGGPQINADLKARGIPENRKDGIRITDDATLQSVQRGLGDVNDTLVAALSARGVNATGIKTGVFGATVKDDGVLGHVGEVSKINNKQIDEAIAAKSVPIVSCIGEDTQRNALNVNGDTAAAALTIDRKPHRYIALSDVPGVLDRNKQVVSVINDTQVAEKMIADGVITDGMIPKVRENLAVLEHLPQDSSVVIAKPSSLLPELFTHQGAGTLLRHGDAITRLQSKDAIDQQKVRELIETSFNKKLVDTYFDELPDDAEFYITERGYNGIAVVIPGEEGQPAYLDKLVVSSAERGHGVGDELVSKIQESHPEGLHWRVRKDNPALSWYRSKGLGHEYDVDDEWIVFFTKEVKPDARAMLASAAVLRQQTVVTQT